MLFPLRAALSEAARDGHADPESIRGQGQHGGMKSAVRRAVEHRLALRDFDARCDAALKHYLVSGQAFSSDEVLAKMRRRLDEGRAQLLGKADEAV